MDGRIDHFSYLIEEVESDFFQKTAEEIAVVQHREEVKVFPPVPERFQKLATVVYQSNQHGLTKQASEDVFSDMSSYEAILSKIAASAYWEPLGMTKSAVDFLTVLEEVGVDEDELEKFAEHILEDTIGTDALIEASMEKEAGDGRPVEEIYDELVKEALAAKVLGAVGKGGKWLGGQLFSRQAGREILQSGRAVAGAVSRAGRRVAGKPRKFERMGKAIQEEGIRQPIARAATAIPRGIKSSYRRLLGKGRSRGLAARRARLNTLRKKMSDLRGQLRGAGPGQAEAIGSKIQDLNKAIAHQRGRVKSQIGKIRKGREAAGIEKVPGKKPAPKKKIKVTTEGADKAREAATPPPKTQAPGSAPTPPPSPSPTPSPTGAPKPKGKKDPGQVDTRNLTRNLDKDPHGPPTAAGQGPAPVRKQPIGNVDTSEAQRAAAETGKKMEGFGGQAKTKAQREADEASARARKRAEELFEGKAGVSPGATKTQAKGGYREKRPEKRPEKKPEGKPEQAPGGRPPKDAVEGKGQGVMDAWKKWGEDGWGKLSEVEKSRLIRAGVVAGGVGAAYKTVFGD